jgi:hypothetical protein
MFNSFTKVKPKLHPMRNLMVWILILYLSFSSGAQSIQSIYNTAGGSSQTNQIFLEWSIGEAPLIEHMYAVDGSYSISNGLLQPFYITPNNGPFFENFEVRILPNPTYGKFEIHFLTLSKGAVNITLHDAQGRILLSRRTYSYGVGSIERFDISKLAAATYFLKIELKPERSSTSKKGNYKIVKI